MKINKFQLFLVYYGIILSLLIVELLSSASLQFHLLWPSFCFLCLAYYVQAPWAVIAPAYLATVLTTTTDTSNIYIQAYTIGLTVYLTFHHVQPILKIKATALLFAVAYFFTLQGLLDIVYYRPTCYTLSWWASCLMSNMLLMAIFWLTNQWCTRRKKP